MVNALGICAYEGRVRLRNASVSCHKAFEPGVSEWGNPIGISDHLLLKSAYLHIFN